MLQRIRSRWNIPLDYSSIIPFTHTFQKNVKQQLTGILMPVDLLSALNVKCKALDPLIFFDFFLFFPKNVLGNVSHTMPFSCQVFDDAQRVLSNLKDFFIIYFYTSYYHFCFSLEGNTRFLLLLFNFCIWLLIDIFLKLFSLSLIK